MLRKHSGESISYPFAFGIEGLSICFWAQAVEEALRKDRDCPAEKETPKKGKGRGQASERIRSPLHQIWKRVQARGAKVHACGAQTKLEFQEISGKVERVRGNS